MYGFNWKTIAKHIPQKTAKQIGDRYHNYLKCKTNDNNKFSEAEDRKLMERYKLLCNNKK